MAGLFDLLPGEGKLIGIVRAAIEAGEEEGAILEIAQEQIQGIALEKVSSVIEYLTNTLPQGIQYIQNIGRFVQPALNQIPPSIGNLLRNFSYVVKVNGLLPGSTTPVSTFVTVSSNQLLDKAGAAKRGFDMVNAQFSGVRAPGRSGENIQPQNADVVQVTQNPEGLTGPIFPGLPEGFGHGV